MAVWVRVASLRRLCVGGLLILSLVPDGVCPACCVDVCVPAALAAEEPKNDRRVSSSQKNRGRPKKGGGGGKHTWGRAGEDHLYDADAAVDRGA